MDWVLGLSIAVYLVAVGFALARSWADGWPPRQTLGRAVFLLGAALALFLDDAVATLAIDAPVLTAVSELLGVAVMVVGGVVAWWRTDGDGSSQ